MGPKSKPNEANEPTVMTPERLAELGLTPEDFDDEPLDDAVTAWHTRWLETGEGEPWPPGFNA